MSLSLLSFVAELYMVSRLPVFFMTLLYRVFMCMFSWIYSVNQRIVYTFFSSETGGGGGDNERSLRFIILLLHGLSCVFQ